jgi:hypothetical protein
MLHTERVIGQGYVGKVYLTATPVRHEYFIYYIDGFLLVQLKRCLTKRDIGND